MKFKHNAALRDSLPGRAGFAMALVFRPAAASHSCRYLGWGFIRPTVLLPTKFLASLNEQQLKNILLHELAHNERRDVLAQAEAVSYGETLLAQALRVRRQGDERRLLEVAPSK